MAAGGEALTRLPSGSSIHAETQLPDSGFLALLARMPSAGSKLIVDSSSRFGFAATMPRPPRPALISPFSGYELCQLGNPRLYHDDRPRPDRVLDRAVFEAGDAPRCLVNVPESRGLVPPRPNLGPESTLDSPPLVGAFTAAGILASFLLLLAMVCWVVIRRARGRRRDVVPVAQGEPDDTPRGGTSSRHVAIGPRNPDDAVWTFVACQDN